MLDAVLRLRMVANFGNGQSLGPVLEWPAWLFDAVMVVQASEAMVETALIEAERNPF